MFTFSAVAGDTPLYHSAIYGRADAARYLLDHGADPLAGKLHSPLYGAAKKGLSLSQQVCLFIICVVHT
jgi:ankyrin repeat protein